MHKAKFIINISPIWDCWSTICKRQNSSAKGGTPQVWRSRDAHRGRISQICPVKI